MLFYGLIIFLSTMFAYLYQKISNIDTSNSLMPGGSKPAMYGYSFYFLAFLALYIPAALRFDTGTDYVSYYNWFNKIASGNYDYTYFEPAFFALITGISSLGLSAQWMFGVASLVTLGLVFIAVRRDSVSPAFSISLFVLTAFYFISFNLVRQFIAVAIVFFVFRYIIDGKQVRYYLGIFIATLFHTTAWVAVPFYILLRKRYKLQGYILIMAIMASLIVFREYIVDMLLFFYPTYQFRTDGFMDRFVFSEVFIGMGLAFLFFIKYLLKRKLIKMDDISVRIAVNLVFFSLVSHVFLAWIPGINRLLYYLDMGYILIIPMLISKLGDKGMRILITGIVYLLLIVYMYISIVLNGSYDVIPYQSILT